MYEDRPVFNIPSMEVRDQRYTAYKMYLFWEECWNLCLKIISLMATDQCFKALHLNHSETYKFTLYRLPT